MRQPVVEEADELRPLLAWLQREGPAVFQTVSDELVVRVPELAADTDGGRGLSHSVASHLPMLTAYVEGGARSGTAQLPEVAANYAEQLAHAGTSLPALLRSYEVGHAALWHRFVRSLRDGPDAPDAEVRAAVLERTSSCVFDYMHEITALVVDRYSRARSRIEWYATSRLTEAVTATLEGRLDELDAERTIGYRLAGTHVGFVAWADDDRDVQALLGLLGEVRARLGCGAQLHVPAGERAAFGWFSVRGERWRRAWSELVVPPGAGLACGQAHAGVGGFRTSHREALEARRVAQRLGRRTPVAYADVAVLALASRDTDLALAFVEDELGGLLAGEGTRGVLYETLRVYLEHGASPTRCARRLDVHPNTVVKRLERVEELLGHEIDVSSLRLRLALELCLLLSDRR